MLHSEFERLELSGVTVLLGEEQKGSIVVARLLPRFGMQVLITPHNTYLDLVMVDLAPNLPMLPTSFVWDPEDDPY